MSTVETVDDDCDDFVADVVVGMNVGDDTVEDEDDFVVVILAMAV